MTLQNIQYHTILFTRYHDIPYHTMDYITIPYHTIMYHPLGDMTQK